LLTLASVFAMLRLANRLAITLYHNNKKKS